MVRSLMRHIVTRTCRPLLVRYLSKTRRYRYKNIRLDISPDVFHPGFFFSTQLLLQYINGQPLKGKDFLELGCGSGLISIAAAKKGAKVMASDINPTAIDFLQRNAAMNNVDLNILQSDLFQSIPRQSFDLVAINPPYYKKTPRTPRDHAWYCGENGEYFDGLFAQLGDYMHTDTRVLMVLFDGCDMEMILKKAVQNGFRLNPLSKKKNLLEENYIFGIEKIKATAH